MSHGIEALGALILIALATGIAGLAQVLKERRPYSAKLLMSPAEQEAYRRLRAALPDRLIFAQVQLCRFIEARKGLKREWHNRIAQLSADFVICEADSSVIAVVEIDDRTHGRAKQRQRDEKKNRACSSAGIRMIRWPARGLPDVQTMREELALNRAASAESKKAVADGALRR